MRAGNTCHKIANKHNNFTNLIIFRQIFVVFSICFAFFILMNINFANISKNTAFSAVESQTEVEEDLKDETNKQLDSLDFSSLQSELDKLNFDFNLFSGKSFKSFISSLINGEETLNISSLFTVILSSLKVSLRSLLAPLSLILVIILLCTMFNNIRSGKVSGTGEIIYLVCFSVICIILATISSKLLVNVKNGLLSLQNQMNAVFPILITLMTTMGGVVSVKAYSPMLAFLANTISNIFVYVLLPLFTFSLVLAFIGNLSENTTLDKLSGFVHSLFKWIIGVVFAVFMSFLSIQGITAGSSDGISIKATKFAIKNYVPFLGGYISDGFELIKAGGMLIKNATGFASIVLLLATVLAPILTIGLMELGLKLLAGVVEPLGDKRASNLLYSVAKSLRLLVGIVVGVALMYFLTLFLITCSVSNFI